MFTDRSFMQSPILVIAAHPDDEVLGCGGTIARLTAEGAEATVLILGEGITSRYGQRADADLELVAAHRERAQRAGALIGAKRVILIDFPDQKFETTPLLDITKTIEKTISEVCPDTIFTQHGGDLNLDHVLTFRATLTATRPMKGRTVKAVYAYPVASSSEWSFGRFAPRFEPNTYFDIATTLERKIAAMQIYESETRAFPHPRSPEALRAAAQYWGSHVGVMAAEPFQCIWRIA